MRTPPRTAFGALAALLTACASPPPQAPAPPPPPPAPTATAAAVAQAFADSSYEDAFADPDRRKKIAAAFPAIDALIEDEIRDEKLPSVVVGVVVDGELAYVKGFGVTNLETKVKPDADTVYRIGSITKSFTALAVLGLRDEGKLSLDDPLTRFVPEAGGLVYPTRDAPPITLRQMLTHTSGLPRIGGVDYTRPDRDVTEAELLSSLTGFALESAPGTRHGYSNLAYGLLGLAAGRAAGTSIGALVGSKILAPLGMTSTTFDRDRVPSTRLATAYGKRALGKRKPVPHWRLGALEGAGGLYSTVRDLARYVAFQLAAYPARNAPEAGPIRRSSVREAHFNGLRSRPLRVSMRDAATKGQSMVNARASSYAYGWSLTDTCELDDLVAHGGVVDGYASDIAFLPDRGVGVVMLSNAVDAGVDWLSEAVLAALKKGGGLSKRSPDPKLAAAFEPAMKRFLAVYDAWDEPVYDAMLAKGRPRLPGEKVEIEGYKALHGACSGYTPTEILSPLQARFALRCERGQLELEVTINPGDHLIMGFDGTSRGVEPPAKLAAVAGRIAGLVKRWDEGVYKKHLAARFKDRDKTAALFERLRASHGACDAKEYERTPTRSRFALVCERGSNLKLTLSLDQKDDDVVAGYWIGPEATGACPVR